MKYRAAHTHPINTEHGARNKLVDGCPLCEEYKRQDAKVKEHYREALEAYRKLHPDCNL